MNDMKTWRPPPTDHVQTSAMIYKPTRRERFWRFLGYRYHSGDAPENPPQLGWINYTVRFNFCWRDRLRLLLTGRFKMTFTLYTDMPSPMNIAARTDWHILPPGQSH